MHKKYKLKCANINWFWQLSCQNKIEPVSLQGTGNLRLISGFCFWFCHLASIENLQCIDKPFPCTINHYKCLPSDCDSQLMKNLLWENQFGRLLTIANVIFSISSLGPWFWGEVYWPGYITLILSLAEQMLSSHLILAGHGWSRKGVLGGAFPLPLKINNGAYQRRGRGTSLLFGGTEFTQCVNTQTEKNSSIVGVLPV